MRSPPPEFPLRTIPSCTWPPLVARMQGVWSAYLELCRNETRSAEEIEALQLSQLRTLLFHAKENVPYYHEVLRSLDPRSVSRLEDLRQLPLLSRFTYQQDAAAFRARVLPPGTKVTGELHTAGSSGIPVTVVQTNLVQLWWQAFSLRDLRWAGVDMRGTLAAIRYFSGNEEQRQRLALGVRLPHWNDQLRDLLDTGPSYALDIHQPPERQLSFLNDVRPTTLISYPSNLEVLARLALDEDLLLPELKTVLSISEALSQETQALLEQAFDATVKNTYSCMEAGYLASPCPQGGGLHVHAENVLLEILNDEGSPCPPGEIGRVVLTTLRNFANPLLRYDILDQAAWAETPCGCGSGLPLIDAPRGKKHPPFRLPSGSSKNSMGIAVALRKIGKLAQFRVRQTALDHVEVRVLPTRSFNDATQDEIRRVLCDFFEAKVTVDIALLERPELSSNGKAGHLQCEVTGEIDAQAPG